MKTLIECLLLSCCLLLSDAHTLTGTYRTRTAAEYLEFHRQQRGPRLVSKDLVLGYPDETLQTQILIGDPQSDAQRPYTVSVETETDWLYIFDKSLANQTTLTNLNQTFTGQYINYNITGSRYSALTSYVKLDSIPDFVNQVFASVPAFLPPTSEIAVDGVLGLGFPGKRTTKSDPSCTVIPPVINILNQIATQKYYYVLHVNATPSTPNDHSFDITFGADNPRCDEYFGWTDLFYLQVADNSIMYFELDGYVIGDWASTMVDTAILDTGSPIITGPFQSYQNTIKVLQPTYDYKYGLFVAPCANVATFPDMIFQIGGQEYHVPAAYYLVDIGLGNGDCMVAFDRTPSSYSTIHWIVGKPFLLAHCAYFDVEHEKIGFSLEVQK